MNESITIRICTAKDVASLVTLGRKTFVDTFAVHNTAEDMEIYLDKTFTKEKVEEELCEPGAVVFMALHNDMPVGYARVRTSKTPEELNGQRTLEIERLYVDHHYIGKGIGNQLMQTCLTYAAQHEFEMVWLGVWEYNERAIAFYKKWGFEKFSQHTFILGNDPQTDFLMKKKINK
jgi:ribosomal protein S18 acetylase RimI-like enzyme